MDLDFIDQEAREKYKLRRKQDLEKCRQFLTVCDYQGLQTIGHNLKGNGISFGFPELSILGERLEFSAKTSDFEQVKHLIDNFEAWILGQDQVANVIQSSHSILPGPFGENPKDNN